MKTKLSLIGEVFHDRSYVERYGEGRYFAFLVMDDSPNVETVISVSSGDMVIVKLDKPECFAGIQSEYYLDKNFIIEGVGRVVLRQADV